MTSELLAPNMRVFATVVLFALVAWVANLVRHHRLTLRDSLLWLLSTLVALTFTAFPQTLTWVSRALQIQVPANALFVLTFLYVLINLLSLTIVVSTNSARVRRLTQESAILRAELERIRASCAPADASGEPRRGVPPQAPRISER